MHNYSHIIIHLYIIGKSGGKVNWKTAARVAGRRARYCLWAGGLTFNICLFGAAGGGGRAELVYKVLFYIRLCQADGHPNLKGWSFFCARRAGGALVTMKERYFTSEKLAQQYEAMLGELELGRKGRRLIFEAESAALLVVDMQRVFLEEASHAFIPAAAAIVEGIVELANVFSKRELPVIVTRHGNTVEDSGMMSKWWGNLVERDDPLSEIVAELGEGSPVWEREPVVVAKSQYDAFYGTCLDEVLRERGVKQLVITGVMTNLCCETTARAGFVRGYEVFFVGDGTAAYNREFHRASLRNLAFGVAELVSAGEIMRLVEGFDAE